MCCLCLFFVSALVFIIIINIVFICSSPDSLKPLCIDFTQELITTITGYLLIKRILLIVLPLIGDNTRVKVNR